MDFEFVENAPIYSPPWASISTFDRGGVHKADYSDEDKSTPASTARLYPNVRGCGYPPELNCEKFYEDYSNNTKSFTCWVSTMDTSIGTKAWHRTTLSIYYHNHWMICVCVYTIV